MRIASAVENFIRHSSLNKYIASFRNSHPAFYLKIKRIWDSVTPMSSKEDLARYQKRAIDNFTRLAIKDIKKSIILEIGSDCEGKIIKELASLGAKKVVGINPGLENDLTDESDFSCEHLPDNCQLLNDDASKLSFDDETFTHIFSVSVFEHLNNFKDCLSEMHRVLIPGGIVYADFGPIWSSSIGHHVYAKCGDEEARHWNPLKNPIYNYSHLLTNKDEMRADLQGTVSDSLLEEILKWVYELPYINRMFYEDYMRIIEASKFEIVYLKKDQEKIDSDINSKLQLKYPGFNNFDIRNVELVLKK